MVALNKTYRKTLTPDRSAKDSGLRYYSPEISRWLNRDPVGMEGSLNLHSFVRNSPIGGFDILGLMWPEPTGGTGWDIGDYGGEEQNPAPQTQEEDFQEWYDEQIADLSWLAGLPDCPCVLCVSVTLWWNTAANPDPDVWEDPTTLLWGYHPGAEWCIRSSGGNATGSVADDNYIPTSTTTTLRHGRRPGGMLIRGMEGLADACNGPAGKEVADGIPEERRSRDGGLEGGDAPRDGREVYCLRAVAFGTARGPGLADTSEPFRGSLG